MVDSNQISDQKMSEGLQGVGGAALFASVVLCASAHLILRHAASDLDGSDLWKLFFDPRILSGLAVYGLGTALWLFCLSKLDLSLAFPASAIQFVVVFAGAKWILGEPIPALRLVGGIIILIGIALLFFERKERRV
ncbi:MAG: drug/metabolite transporter (DMT)-like permease [Verrucomicrobiales bacterium]|jgi:drug/metabolite transporter (DMT)-like permease